MTQSSLISQLQRYTQVYAPSGTEKAVRDLLLQDLHTLGYTPKQDALGNLTLEVGNPTGKRVLLVAHMDEIGLIVSHIDARGFCYVTALGGVYPATCVGGRVEFANGVRGVVYAETTAPKTPNSLEEIYIDVGATSPADCPVQVGDVAAFMRPLEELSNGRVVSKSLDDRVGCVILLEVLRQLQETPYCVIFAWSVQEEVGVRGATPLGYHTDPEIGLAVDVTRTGDTPETLRMAVRLGAGPAIKVRDAGMISDPTLVAELRQVAATAGIAVQSEILSGGSTDARAIQLARAGVRSGCISIPCRYVHTPSEMVDLHDVSGAIALLGAYLKTSPA